MWQYARDRNAELARQDALARKRWEAHVDELRQQSEKKADQKRRAKERRAEKCERENEDAQEELRALKRAQHEE